MTDEHSEDAFTIEQHGDVTVVRASPALELLDLGLADNAAEAVIAALQGREAPQVVVDLTKLPFFGSLFLSILLRCHKMVSTRGGTMVLAGASVKARELFRITRFDLVWPIYSTPREAIDNLNL